MSFNIRDTKFTIKVEPDDIKPGKFLVAIREESGKMHSVSARDITEKEASKLVSVIKHAFEMGALAHAAHIQRLMNKGSVQIREQHED